MPVKGKRSTVGRSDSADFSDSYRSELDCGDEPWRVAAAPQSIAVGHNGCRMTQSGPATVEAPIGYAWAGTVVADDERPGLLRSPSRADSSVYDDAGGVAFETCTIRDLDATDEPPGFAAAGFEAVRLPDRPGLVDLLAEVRDAGRIATEQESRLRDLLTGAVIELADGSGLRVDHVAEEGVIVRQAGPDGLPVEGAEHHGAVNVHIDQDVQGTPLRQLFPGGATEVFGHHSPDSANHTSAQHLVNLWLALRQVTRPLALMDGRSLDRRRHQLRYRLPVDGFLDRDRDQTVNDIWQCLHDPAQAWWFRAEAELGDAYVFDTLSTAHVSFVLPGEDVAADRYRRLGAVLDAVRADAPDRARELAAVEPTDLDPGATVPLRNALAAMHTVLAEAGAGADLDEGWCSRAQVARDAVVRQSLELRAVVTRLA